MSQIYKAPPLDGGIVFTSNDNSIGITETPSGPGEIVDLEIAKLTGTWMPVLQFGGASVGISYAVQEGYYTKVSNIVFLGFSIVLTNKGSSVGNATISGLPFASFSHTNGNSGALATNNQIFDTTGNQNTELTCSILSASSSITLFNTGGLNPVNATNNAFNNSSQIKVNMFYFSA